VQCLSIITDCNGMCWPQVTLFWGPALVRGPPFCLHCNMAGIAHQSQARATTSMLQMHRSPACYYPSRSLREIHIAISYWHKCDESLVRQAPEFMTRSVEASREPRKWFVAFLIRSVRLHVVRANKDSC
jgi:hypothetical protein